LKIFALTGGIASGKSTVTLKLRSRGYSVLDADEIVRQRYGKGQSIYNAIVSAFGNEILDLAGEIDRKRLGALIFSNAEARKRLDSATHPIVEAEILRMIEDANANNEKMIFVDSPLLVEMGKLERYDAVILVYVTPDIQLQRLMTRNHLTYDEAMQRINSQMPIEGKKAYADFIVDNSGPLDALDQQIDDLLVQLLELVEQTKAPGCP